MSSEKAPLINTVAQKKKLPFPYGLFPASLRPYAELMRLHRPSGTIMIFWPYAFGATMAAYQQSFPLKQYWLELGKFLIAAFFVRSAGCTINDIADREFDAGVERTKGRPLASGRVSVFSAYVFCILQWIAAIFVFLPYNSITLWAAVLQAIPMSTAYPYMKRITYWPQAWLGLTMSMGIFIGWVAIAEQPNWILLGSFMFGFVAWTLHFDTIYACQDRKDDIKVGVKSTAVILGDYVIPFAMACTTVFVGLLAYAGMLNEQTNIYYFITVAGTALHFAWQLVTVDLDDGDSCALNFTRNGQLGWVLWGGMLVDYLVKIGYVRIGEF